MGSARGGDASRILPVRLRLRILHIRTFRAGEEEESPSGDSECPARAAHKRTGRGPLVNHPGQRRGRSASPSFGNHLYPLGFNLMYDSEALFNGG